MPTLVQDIYRAALGTSILNRASQHGDAEIVGVVNRSIRRYFTQAARINPRVFGRRVEVGFNGAVSGWPRPDCNVVYRVEKADGTEVVTVDFDQRGADPVRPAVYELGGIYYSAGNALDPVAGSLFFFVSARPRAATALTGDPAGTLDPLWVEDFNDLPILDVAMYLARKDGRAADLAALAEEWKTEAERYRLFLQMGGANVLRDYGTGPLGPAPERPT